MHTGPITSVVLDTNNKVYTGGYDKNIFYWTEELDFTFIDSHNHLINCLCLSNNGEFLASGSSDYEIRIYDLKNEHRLLKILKGHADDIESLTFSDDDKYLISVSRDKRAIVWNVENGSIITIYENHQKDVLAVWTYDEFVFTSSDDGTVQKWNMVTGEKVGEIGPFACELDTLDGSRENKVLAIGADDGSILFYDIENLTKVNNFQAHEQGIKKVSFSYGGEYLLTAGYDHSIKIWDYNSCDLIKTLEKSVNQWERSLVWSRNNEKIYGGSFGQTYCVWDLKSGEFYKRNFNLSTPSINDFDISNDNLYTASDDGILRINKEEVDGSPKVLCNAVCCSENEDYVLWGDHSSTVYLVKGNKLVTSINLETGPVNSIFYDLSNNSFYVGTYGGFIHVIEPKLGKETSRFNAHDGAIKSLVTTLDKIIIVTADYRILAFDKNQYSLFKEYFGPTAIVNDICLIDDENFVIVSRDKVVRVYCLKTGAILAQHNNHKYSIKSVTVDESKNIISGDYWGNIIIWNLEKNTLTESIKLANNGISSLKAFNNYIYCSSYDGAIYKFSNDGNYTVYSRLFTQQLDRKGKVLV